MGPYRGHIESTRLKIVNIFEECFITPHKVTRQKRESQFGPNSVFNRPSLVSILHSDQSNCSKLNLKSVSQPFDNFWAILTMNEMSPFRVRYKGGYIQFGPSFSMTIHYDEYTLTTKGKEFFRGLYYTKTKGVPVLTLSRSNNSRMWTNHWKS